MVIQSISSKGKFVAAANRYVVHTPPMSLILFSIYIQSITIQFSKKMCKEVTISEKCKLQYHLYSNTSELKVVNLY